MLPTSNVWHIAGVIYTDRQKYCMYGESRSAGNSRGEYDTIQYTYKIFKLLMILLLILTD